VVSIQIKIIQTKRPGNTAKGNIMNKAIGIGLLALGIMLIIFGINSSNSVGSDFSRFFTGSPTNKSIWLLIGGVGSMVVGGVLSLRPAR
jgi:hypothetical protein